MLLLRKSQECHSPATLGTSQGIYKIRAPLRPPQVTESCDELNARGGKPISGEMDPTAAGSGAFAAGGRREQPRAYGILLGRVRTAGRLRIPGGPRHQGISTCTHTRRHPFSTDLQ